MAVGSIRFGNTGVSPFQAMISKPQTYKMNETASASTNLYAGKTKKKSKLVPVLIGAAAALTAGLALGAKYNIFKADNIKNETLQKLVKGLNTAGNKICSVGKTAIDWVKALPKAKDAIKDGAEKVGDTVKQTGEAIAEAAIGG